MKRDLHINQLEETDYQFALNSNTEEESGEYLNLTNEPSNYLAVNFPDNYKVIGRKKYMQAEKTFYILTNPFTKKSSIGYTEDTLIESTNNDPYAGGENVLETPLENTTQTPTHTYVELINDLCLEEGEGLNLDINFPVKFISIKVEKGQVNLYWNDYNNPPRWMNTTDVSYLYTQEVPCEEDVVTNCIIIDKLLQSPKYGNLSLEPETIQTGGNLKMGTYEFYPAYCDVFGNNISDYGTPTNPIPIFDENNNILAQTELDAYTNFAIKLKVKGLDNRYPYYKIVCVERNNVSNTQSAFLEGIHPTTDDTVLYTSSGSTDDEGALTSGNKKISKRVPLSQLFEVKTKYEKIKGTAAINGQQFQWGLYRKPELNLQPVINLFGSLMKWQTSIAKEDIYKNAIAASKYKGFTRNEVQPFALRFWFKDGGYTANFPIISRPEFTGERDIIDPLNPIRASIEANAPDCSTTDRTQKWQFLNTATQLGICEVGDGVPTQEVQGIINKTCTVEDPVATVAAGEKVIDIDETYTDLKTYINDGNIITEIQNALDEEYPEETCFLDNGLDSQCGSPTNIESVIQIRDIINEQNEYIQKCIQDYSKTNPPSYCNLYERNIIDGGFEKDVDFATDFMGVEGINTVADVSECVQTVYKRDFNFYNEDCGYAESVSDGTLFSSQTNTTQSYFHNYYGGEELDDVIFKGGSSKEKTVTYSSAPNGFEDRLHKGALFFKIDKKERDEIIFEITKKSDCDTSDEISIGDLLRYTFYEKCNSTTPLPINIVSPVNALNTDCEKYELPEAGVVDMNEGLLIQLNVSSYPETFYVAIDPPITTENVPLVRDTTDLGPSELCEFSNFSTKYRTSPICGCFGLKTRDVENDFIKVSWDSITIEKVQTYQAICTYNIPIIGDCDPVPYAYGEFAFNESTETYPDNEELYDSSKLNILEEDLSILSEEDRTRFENFYARGVTNGKYLLNESTNFTCSNIRHPKFPDNTLAPFMNTDALTPFSESLVYPMGISFDNNIVKAMLEVALKNNLISKKDYDNIEGFEILRGDNSVSKSVLASGLIYDMYEYTKEDNKYLYSNYPHNDLGDDLLHYTDKNRNQLISHPYNSEKNNKFSFLSPDVFLTKPALPTEMVVSGFQLGSSSGRFVDVEKHPKWTILGKDSRTTADILAGAEVLLETLIKISEITKEQWASFGLANGGNFGSYIALGITAGAYGVQGFMKYGQYRFQWLEIFRNLGPTDNFAGYNVSKGHHNRFIPNDIKFNSDNSVGENEYLRGLSLKKYMKDGRYEYRDNTLTDNKLLVNNWGREESVFLSTGNYPIHYTADYKNHDNNKISPEQGSRTTMSQNNCTIDADYQRNVGSPYVTLKNYIPDQYGTIDSIKWLTTNNKFKLDESTDCKPMFGGTVYISRFTWKRKLPLFTTTAMGEPNKLAFNYRQYKNIAEPKFYCDYENGSVTNFLGFVPAPDIDSDYNFDCLEGSRDFYVKPPSKMYLYYYGITDFLVESEINCNFRYGRNRLEDNFYPQVGDIVRWTQEINVPISEPNTIYYNNTYSLPVSNTPYKRLDTTFSKERQLILAKQNNAVIWSEKDVDENSPVDPWLINRPLNWFEFKSDNGDLIELKQIEGGQVLARFEDKQLILNAVDNLADRMLPQSQSLGTGGIFSTRPAESNTSDLGFSGSQHHQTLSTPYGHITVDAKRGKIHLTTTQGSEVISESVGGQPTYMKNWFRENLPFKILKYYPNIDVDNNYKGIGITMGWDARFDRAFITKKDVVPIKEVLQTCGGFYNSNLSDYVGIIQNYESKDFVFEEIEDCNLKFVSTLIPYSERGSVELVQLDEIEITNTEYFEDVSWTMAFKIGEGWVSYYSFKPNYYSFHNEFFQVGYNYGDFAETMWSHTLSNKSLQVFQGVREPWIVEVPFKNQNVNKILKNLTIGIEAKRYQNKWDYSQHKDIGFNKLVIFNNTNNSGELNLFQQKSYKDSNKYPITNNDNTQDIPYIAENNNHHINYFYNRVINQDNNVPQWLWEKNRIEKTVNPLAVSFTGKRLLERMKGQQFIVRLTQDKESRYSITLKSVINKEIIEN